MSRNDRAHPFAPIWRERVRKVFVRVKATLAEGKTCCNHDVQRSSFHSRRANAVFVQRHRLLDELAQVHAKMQSIATRDHAASPASVSSAIEACKLHLAEAMLAFSKLDVHGTLVHDAPTAEAFAGDPEEDVSRLVGRPMSSLDDLQLSFSRRGNEVFAHAPLHSRPPLLAQLQHITASYGLGKLHRRSIEFARHADSNEVVVRLFGSVCAAKASLLASGITLFETPGFDSRPRAVGLHHPAAVPWCDLAVVLVSATAPFELCEAALVRQLSRQGATVIVLVTQLDLVRAEDRWRIYERIVSGMAQAAHNEVSVYWAGPREVDPSRHRTGIDGPFADALARCREQRATIRQRQLAALRHEVIDALQIGLLCHAPALHASTPVCDALRELVASRDAISATRDSSVDPATQIEYTMVQLANEIAHNAAAHWSQTPDTSFDATRLVELAIGARAFSYAGAAMRSVELLRARANVALHHLADVRGAAWLMPALPAFFTPPQFALRVPLPATILPRSWGWRFGRWGFYLGIRHNLPATLSMAIVKRSLHAYMEQVEAWKCDTLADMSVTLTGHIERIHRGDETNNPALQEATRLLRANIESLRCAKPSGL